jgi:DNA-binding response OmpR family regulator
MSLRRLLFIQDSEIPDQKLMAQFSQLPITTDTAMHIDEAIRRVRSSAYDLIVVATTAAPERANKLCTEIRLLTTAPIIMIAPIEHDEQISHALQQDVDVVLPIPVSPSVVAGHVAALLRRVRLDHADSTNSASVASQFYDDGCVNIDLIRRRVVVNGQKIRFTPTEFRLLSLLVRHPDQVLTYDQILNQVWGWEITDHRIVHTFLAQLRAKFGAVGPRYFANEYGIGYRFVPQTSE